jgi:hypothetical protein
MEAMLQVRKMVRRHQPLGREEFRRQIRVKMVEMSQTKQQQWGRKSVPYNGS